MFSLSEATMPLRPLPTMWQIQQQQQQTAMVRSSKFEVRSKCKQPANDFESLRVRRESFIICVMSDYCLIDMSEKKWTMLLQLSGVWMETVLTDTTLHGAKATAKALLRLKLPYSETTKKRLNSSAWAWRAWTEFQLCLNKLCSRPLQSLQRPWGRNGTSIALLIIIIIVMASLGLGLGCFPRCCKQAKLWHRLGTDSLCPDPHSSQSAWTWRRHWLQVAAVDGGVCFHLGAAKDDGSTGTNNRHAYRVAGHLVDVAVLIQNTIPNSKSKPNQMIKLYKFVTKWLEPQWLPPWRLHSWTDGRILVHEAIRLPGLAFHAECANTCDHVVSMEGCPHEGALGSRCCWSGPQWLEGGRHQLTMLPLHAPTWGVEVLLLSRGVEPSSDSRFKNRQSETQRWDDSWQGYSLPEVSPPSHIMNHESK